MDTVVKRIAVAWICLFPLAAAHAELPAVGSFAADLKDDLKAQLDGSTVVVSMRVIGTGGWPWAVHEALATEITAALRADEIDGITAASDSRIESLADPKVEFTAADARKARLVERARLLTGSLYPSKSAKLRLAIWDADTGTTLWKKEVAVPADVLKLPANVPELNGRVVDFCRQSFDKKVGNGICAELAAEALAAAGAKRSGIYTWGRELDDREPILPGDILQMELVEMKGPKFSRNYHHHTAVVEEARPDALVVLQQNVAPKGQIVQRDTWPLAAIKRGYLIAYRPWTGSSPLPPVSPRRRTPPTIVRKGPAIDLLHTLNPRLDAVRGIWFFEEETLRPNRDDWARLQVPFAPPERYTLRLKVKRLVGKDQLGVGLIVGGHQTMMSFDAYQGTISGLHLVDGKSVKNNPTTYRGNVLPQDQTIDLRIAVTPDSVIGHAGKQQIVEWNGDAARLGQDEKYAIPRQDWLYLASWNSHFSISEFLLDDNSASAR